MFYAAFSFFLVMGLVCNNFSSYINPIGFYDFEEFLQHTHTHRHTFICAYVPVVTVPALQGGGENTHLQCSCGMTRVSSESGDKLRGSPSCTAVLDRHNNTCEWIIHRRHVHIHSHALKVAPVTQILLPLMCSYCSCTCLLLQRKEPTVLSCQRGKTSWRIILSCPPPALPQPPCWLLISNSWVTSWEICEWTVRPVLLSGSADFSPLQDYETQ